MVGSLSGVEQSGPAQPVSHWQLVVVLLMLWWLQSAPRPLQVLAVNWHPSPACTHGIIIEGMLQQPPLSYVTEQWMASKLCEMTRMTCRVICCNTHDLPLLIVHWPSELPLFIRWSVCWGGTALGASKYCTDLLCHGYAYSTTSQKYVQEIEVNVNGSSRGSSKGSMWHRS